MKSEYGVCFSKGLSRLFVVTPVMDGWLSWQPALSRVDSFAIDGSEKLGLNFVTCQTTRQGAKVDVEGAAVYAQCLSNLPGAFHMGLMTQHAGRPLAYRQ